jgi:hypothetical protein
MPESPLVQTETNALNELQELIAARAKGESETELGFRRRRDQEERDYRVVAQQLDATYNTELEALKAQYARTRQQVLETYQRTSNTTQSEYDQAKQQADEQLKKDQRRSKKAKDESGWQALAVFEGSRDDGIRWRRQLEADWTAAVQELDVKLHDVGLVLKRCGRMAVASPQEAEALLAESSAAPPSATHGASSAGAPPATEAAEGAKPLDQQAGASPAAAEPQAQATGDDPFTQLRHFLDRVDEGLVQITDLKLPKILRVEVLLWPFLILGLVIFGVLVGRFGVPTASIAGVVTALAAGIGARLGLGALARPNVVRHAVPLRKALADAEQLVERNKDWIKHEFDGKVREFEQRRADKVRAAEELMTRQGAEAQERHRQRIAEADAKYPPLLERVRQRRDDDLKKAEEKYPPLIAGRKEKYQKDKQDHDESYRKAKETTDQLYKDAWNSLIKSWTEGMARVDGSLRHVNDEASRRFLEWSAPALDGWKPPSEVPPGLRFGVFAVDLSQFPNGIPVDPRLKTVPTHFDLPALLPFPIQGSMLIKAADAGKDAAITLFQAIMLRYLTSVPPGKVRFTIIDPVGLGENFAAFMHLGDYHELLVTNRIWTEAPHIEQRLTDLTEHMENVIQKYLRNEFETIEEYNTMAGEVAEPFRVVVVANFPTNFNDHAIRRLVSIVSSGARCGVYALVLLDTKLTLPTGFQLKDLETHCVNMIWKEGRLHWREPNFGRYPLVLDAPPEQERFSELLHVVGNAARDANRVEVPFEFIAPKPEQYWSFDTSQGVDIPLGRAGATKLQHLKLGKGTSQHCLISGKTGSGKSTLLHALITNGALRYSPDELELYLIDFKKGVEFKVYAAMELPHARVIAVESEREFGLSVLQRLDAELKERGEIYRQLGVQDLAGYREVRPDVPMPRILLIVDEFQEFFIEDDKIAQEVSLLLDRLVRQGRAFGMHVHLGSQTLGGQYSLPRATLGQMAVRIALQCSEADAHLILSEDNTAARLLTRPGEAIYNDANGMIEGNNLFQVVWLSDERRELYLEKIRGLIPRMKRSVPPPIVFEGNLPSEVKKNPLLNELIERPEWPEAPKADYAWLGEAIAIKDPTCIVFRPQSGNNVLIVGQNEEAALAMMMMSAVSIAAQHPPVGAQTSRFYLLDGSPADSALAGKLGQLSGILPHPVQSVSWRDVSERLTELAAEVERRQKGSSEDQGPVFLLIYDLQRWRDLRKSDDDFGFSRYDEDKPAPPSKRLLDILRDGPPVGIHTIVWCDSVNNLNRTFDRQGLKEFENRVLFQMSSNDSSAMIDNPAASKVGENRALYFSEEENRIEKFRPYGLPDPEWLQRVQNRFAARPVPPIDHGKDGQADGARAAPVIEARAASASPVEQEVDPPVEAL